MAGDTFAEYLAKYLIANQGYQLNLPPEAEPLAGACDIVLARQDGYSLLMVGLVDGERNPHKQFSLSRDQLIEMGGECLKYSGSFRGTRMPVGLQIIETTQMPVTTAQQQRLGKLRRYFSGKTHINATAVDVNQKQVWSPGRYGFISIMGRLCRKLVQQQRVGLRAEDLQPAAVAPVRTPVITYGLMALMSLIFLVANVAGGSDFGTLSAPQLLDVGGLNLDPVASGELWRMFTSMFLHGGFLHIFMNMLVLYFIGPALENMVGRAWYLAMFIISGLGGAAFSLMFNDPQVVSVGASGAIMGIVAAAYACSYHLPIQQGRTQVQMTMMQVLIPSILPIVVASGTHVDFYSHIGGAIIGGLLGWLAYKFWPRHKPQPGLQKLALILSMLLSMGCVYSGTQAYMHKQGGDLAAVELMPKEQLSNIRELVPQIDAMLLRYPQDPRLYLVKGVMQLEDRDYAGAALNFRKGLSLKAVLGFNFKPQLTYSLSALLALALKQDRRGEEAQRIATPEVCQGAEARFTSMLQSHGLCN